MHKRFAILQSSPLFPLCTTDRVAAFAEDLQYIHVGRAVTLSMLTILEITTNNVVGGS